MKISPQPVLKDLVLIGGGHSHVAVVKSFGMKPIPGVRLTVISRDVHTPYSGMLPGYVAGHYGFDEVHIDLRPLTQFAGARLYHNEAVRIDPVNKTVICKGRPPVPYDVLSINIGSTPRIGNIPGAADFAVAVKPINKFVDRWQKLLDRVIAHSGSHKVCVVGAGAAGVELLLAIQFRLQNELAGLGRSSEQLIFHLVCKSEHIMPGFPSAVAKRFDAILDERGVQVHRGFEASGAEDGVLTLSNGDRLVVDETLFVTAAGAAARYFCSGRCRRSG
jgi:selenide,water dikinase